MSRRSFDWIEDIGWQRFHFITVERFLMPAVMMHGAMAVRRPFEGIFESEPSFKAARESMSGGPFVPGLGQINAPARLPLDLVDYRRWARTRGVSSPDNWLRVGRDTSARIDGAREEIQDSTQRRDLDQQFRSDALQYWARSGDAPPLAPEWHEMIPFELNVTKPVRASFDFGRQRRPFDYEASCRQFSEMHSSSWDAPVPTVLGPMAVRVLLYPSGIIQVFFSGNFLQHRTQTRRVPFVAESLVSMGIARASATVEVGEFSGTAAQVSGAIAERVARSVLADDHREALRSGGRSATLSGSTRGRFLATRSDWLDRWVEASTRDNGNQNVIDDRISRIRVVGVRRDDTIVSAPRRSGIAAVATEQSLARLAWNFTMVRELAESQKMVLPVVERLFRSPSSEGDVTVERMRALVSSLTTTHLGLPAHHRKWFYKCQETLGIADFNPRVDALADRMRISIRSIPQERVMNVNKLVISVKNSGQLGVVNLGSIVGDIESIINHPHDPATTQDARNAVAELTTAVHDSTEISASGKEKLLGALKTVASGIDDDSYEREQAGRVVRRLKESLSSIADVAQVWSVAGPALLAFFS
jgi:hypothetical protein